MIVSYDMDETRLNNVMFKRIYTLSRQSLAILAFFDIEQLYESDYDDLCDTRQTIFTVTYKSINLNSHSIEE